MSAKEFAKAMSFLGIAYDKEFTQEQVEVWFTFFHDTDFAAFKQAVTRLISKSKFLPSIAEIKQELVMIGNPALQLNASEEWDKVMQAVRRFGYYNAEEAVASLDPYTADIVRKMGGFQSICISEDGDWTRKNFVRLFDELSGSRREALLYSAPQLTLAEAQRIAEIKSMERENRLLLEEGE